MLGSLNGWHSPLAEVYQHFEYSIKSPDPDLLRGLDYPKKFPTKASAGWYILPRESQSTCLGRLVHSRIKPALQYLSLFCSLLWKLLVGLSVHCHLRFHCDRGQNRQAPSLFCAICSSVSFTPGSMKRPALLNKRKQMFYLQEKICTLCIHKNIQNHNRKYKKC